MILVYLYSYNKTLEKLADTTSNEAMKLNFLNTFFILLTILTNWQLYINHFISLKYYLDSMSY